MAITAVITSSVVLLATSAMAQFALEENVYEPYNPLKPGYFYKGAEISYNHFATGSGVNDLESYVGPIVPGLKIDSISANGKIIRQIGGEDNGLPVFNGFGKKFDIDLGGPTIPSFKIISITAKPKATPRDPVPNFFGNSQLNSNNLYLPPSNVASAYLPPSNVQNLAFNRFPRQPNAFGSPETAVSMVKSNCYYLSEGKFELAPC